MNFSQIPKFCINLIHRRDKRKDSETEFKKHKLTVSFWEGVNGKSLQLPELSVKHKEFNARMIYGCMLSHLNLVKYAKQKNLPAICVFEDDITLCDDFTERVNYLLANNNDWDIAFLGGYYEKHEAVKETPVKYIYQVNYMAGTHAYIIKASCYDFIIRNITYNYGIDQFYADVLLKHLKGIAFLPFMAAARPSVSDLTGHQTDYEKHFNLFQRSPIFEQPKTKALPHEAPPFLRGNLNTNINTITD